MTTRVLPSLGNIPTLRRIVADDGTYLGCVMRSGFVWEAFPAGQSYPVGSGSLVVAAALVAGLELAA